MLIFAIDDEPKSLSILHKAIAEAAPQAQIMDFPLGTEAVRAIETRGLYPEVVFSDIEMPELDGLALAVKLKQVSPDSKIVFVTAYSEYAVDAIRHRISGYILKPIQKSRIIEELEYVAPAKNSAQEKLTVRCFGQFDVFWKGSPLMFGRKQTKELLAYLIDRQGHSVSRAGIFAALWEDAQYDRARQKYLDVVIRSLRQTLAEHGASEILELKQGMLRIRPEMLSCDLFRFFQGEAAAIDAYRGEYMSAYPWASMTEATLVQISQSRHSR